MKKLLFILALLTNNTYASMDYSLHPDNQSFNSEATPSSINDLNERLKKAGVDPVVFFDVNIKIQEDGTKKEVILEHVIDNEQQKIMLSDNILIVFSLQKINSHQTLVKAYIIDEKKKSLFFKQHGYDQTPHLIEFKIKNGEIKEIDNVSFSLQKLK